jgi:PAS domain S-box-containing protein
MWDRSTNPRLSDEMKLAITIVDVRGPETRLSYCNRAYEELTGFSREEIIGRRMAAPRGAACDLEQIKKLEESMSAGRECTVLLQNLRKNGEPYWNQLHIAPIRSASGVVTHFMGEQRDVTKEVELEREMRSMNRGIELMGSLVRDGMYRRDLDGRLSFSNATYERLTGLSPEQRALSDLLDRVDEDHRSLVQDWHDAAIAGRVVEIQFRVRNSAGESRWTTGRAGPLRDERGVAIGSIGVLADLGAGWTVQ